jgi:transposase
LKRIGLEAGPLSQWGVLAEAELPVVCVEAPHMQAVLKAQTDRNDARGIAQMMRVGIYRPVHVKTLRSQKLRMLLTHRKLLQSKAIAIENDLRGTLRNFGLKVGMVGKMKFEARVKELVESLPDLGWWNHCSLSCGHYANRLSSCIAACWPSSGTMRCADV